MKRIVISEEAKADIRAIPQHIAMTILTAIHRLAEHGSGNVKELKGQGRRNGSASATSASASPRSTGDNPDPHRQQSQGRLSLKRERQQRIQPHPPRKREREIRTLCWRLRAVSPVTSCGNPQGEDFGTYFLLQFQQLPVECTDALKQDQ